MNKIPCEVIRDLFPSYIDGLTSEVTNGEIDVHIKDCSGCRAVLENMTQTEQEEHVMNEAEKKELNFLRKARTRSIRMIIGSISAFLLLAAAIFVIRLFVVGGSTNPNSLAANVRVDGRHVAVDCTAVDSASGISKVSFEDKDGVVDIRTRSVFTGLYSGDFHEEYDASQAVTRVCLNGRVIWDDGANISSFVSEVYGTAHDYVGDMSANNATAMALGMHEYLGGYTSELKTSEEPYRWRILLDQEYTTQQRAVRERDMDAFAHILLGVIGNLSEVEYVYRVDGEELTRTVTADDASMFFGADIKKCAKSPKVLAELIDREGTENYLFHRPGTFEQQA